MFRLIEWSFTADDLRAAFYQIDSVSIVWVAIALFLQQVSYLPIALEIAHAFLSGFIDCSLGVFDDFHEFKVYHDFQVLVQLGEAEVGSVHDLRL